METPSTPLRELLKKHTEQEEKWTLVGILQLTEMGDLFLFSIVALFAEGLAGESASGSGVLESIPESPAESQLHPSHIAVSLSPPEEVLREGRCFLACVLDGVSDSPTYYILIGSILPTPFPLSMPAAS